MNTNTSEKREKLKMLSTSTTLISFSLNFKRLTKGKKCEEFDTILRVGNRLKMRVWKKKSSRLTKTNLGKKVKGINAYL